jgi:Transposase
MSYSKDLRERVISFVKKGGSRRAAGLCFGVNHQTVNNWMMQPLCGKPGPTAPRINLLKLTEAATNRPDALLDELAADFAVHPSTIWRRLRVLGLTQKKRGATPK